MKPFAALLKAGVMMASLTFYFAFFIGFGLGAAFAVVKAIFNL